MATDIIARGMITEYIAGTNINFTENRDGTVEISASGSISSEDSVARDAIGNHKSDTSNPHNVTPAQIGLGNVDNTSDLDKPISTAVQQAIDNKADKTVATTSADGLMSAEDKSKLDSADDTYALKSKYGDTTINIGRKAGTDAGMSSTAEGYATTASGMHSHAEGYDTTASNIASHAEGYDTTASGNSSHAEGIQTTASGNFSHAEGANTTASGGYSHASGKGTQALHDYEAAYGKYNKSNDDTLFSIGDGNSNTFQHNAFEITTTGGKLHDEEIMTQNKISNPNLLINPDFKINQRGITGTFSETGKYFVDRWKLVSGTVTVNSDSSLTLNGSISQVFENAVGENVTASVSAGTASYDNATKTFTITGNGDIISWAKLEYGKTATPFVAPEPIAELIKCLRFYERLSGVIGSGYFYSNTNCIIAASINPKRITPNIINDGTVKIWVQNNVAGVGIDATSVTMPGGYKGNSVSLRVQCTVASGGVVNAPCVMDVRTGILILDAEIY